MIPRLNFEHFKKNMTLIAKVFAELRTQKNVVWQMSRKRRLRVPFNKQHGKWVQTRFKSEQWYLYHIYWSLQRQLSLKKCRLVIWKILRLFVNIFIANDKYSLLNGDNLTKAIQMHISQKSIIFLNFFVRFWNFD